MSSIPSFKGERPFSYFHRLPEKDRALLQNVSQWQWIATVAPCAPTPLTGTPHNDWCVLPESTHSPSHREIMIFLSAYGTGYYSHEHRVYPRQTGTVFLFDHYEARDWKRAPHNSGHCTCLWLHLPVITSDSLTYNTISVTDDQPSYREISQRVYTGDAARLIPKAWDQCSAHPEEPLHWELLKAHISALLLEILNIAQIGQSPNHQASVISYVRRYIEGHFNDDLALQSLSDIAGYSPYFFHRIFRSQTGMTPKAYISHLRIHRAKELLKEGQTIAAVAEAVGFPSPFTFSRFFKHHTHYSPTRWRELN